MPPFSRAPGRSVRADSKTIREKLPFLIDLTPDERRALPKMCETSRGFVKQALTVAERYENILRRSFDVNEMRGDPELLDSLRPVLNALSQLS